VDGHDLREYPTQFLRQNIAVVLQDVFLFSDSIANNISLNNPEVSRADIEAAAKEIGADEFIHRLPGGYDYNVMERGAMLSAGQRQLIAFIRAFLYNPAILVLDEATSSVDTETEELIRLATERYYALLKAEASLAVMAEDIAISERYYQQLDNAVKVGTAFRADLLRVATQLARLRLLVRLGEEELQVCAARLAEILRLAPETELRAAKVDLTPVRLMKDEQLTDLVARAQANRAEIKAVDAAAVGLAREEDRVRVGPLFPTLQGGYAAGGFGGGRTGRTGNFGDQQDFFVGLGWKVGPGGMFDTTRNKIAETRRESVALQKSRTKASVGREVVEAVARSQSAHAQIQITDDAVAAAEEMTKLAGERQASQVGVVLEYVMARDELRQSRLARVRSVVDFNCAQQELQIAVGDAPTLEK
jgi:outer membrane protein TolC